MKTILIIGCILAGLFLVKMVGKHFWLKKFAYKEALSFSRYHQVKLLESEICGCFTCLHIFPTSEIRDWADNEMTAVCPYCGTDTVLSDNLGFPITEKFLKKVREDDVQTAYAELQKLSGKLILDQHNENIDALPYGSTCIGASGCAPISIYNTLILLGKKASLYNILRDFETNQYIILNGRFGTNPYIFGRILKRYKLDYEFYTDTNAMESQMREDDIAILAIWNNWNNLLEGAHFFTVQKAAVGYQTYNAGHVKNGRTLREIIGKGKLIKGYRIII